MKHKKDHADRSSRGGGGGGAGILMDKLLVPRLANYAMNHSLLDLDQVAEDMRKQYREYQRKQMAPFKQMVARAIKVVHSRGGVAKPELQMQV
jgi:hypothetical protein